MKKNHRINNPLAIACVNLKGGVGKTTLAFLLASMGLHKGLKVMVYDLDEQRNITDTINAVWHESYPENLHVKTKIEPGDENLDSDFFVLDCPLRGQKIISEAIGFSDIIIIPVTPDSYGLANLPVLYEMCSTLGKDQAQCPILINKRDESGISRTFISFVLEHKYPIIGWLPENGLIRWNIHNGILWNTRLRETHIAPFWGVYNALWDGWKRISEDKMDQAWHGLD